MLTKRRIIVLVITGVMAALITGGAVLAQEAGSNEDGTGEDPSRQSLASRVAAILSLDEGVVQDAFTQARGDMRAERFQIKLDRLVEQGILTQEQADEMRNWYESRPNFLTGALSGFGKGGGIHGLHEGASFGRHGFSRFGRFGQSHAIPGVLSPDTSGTSY